MNIIFKDHIGIFQDVYEEGFCNHVVNEIDSLYNMGATNNRIESDNSPKHRKDDQTIILNFTPHHVKYFNNTPVQDIFFVGLQKCFDEYSSKYSLISQLSMRASIIKAQRTDPGGGYHIWHSEKSGGMNAYRSLVFMLYLNSLGPNDGGETEFLYQKLRIEPKENTMLLWPAVFTHAHRGNMVLGEKSKYVLTGWFYND